MALLLVMGPPLIAASTPTAGRHPASTAIASHLSFCFSHLVSAQYLYKNWLNLLSIYAEDA